MLDLANIPIYSKDRLSPIPSTLSRIPSPLPLIFAGGPCAFNPLPLAPFIDFFYVGEGEEAIVEIVNSYRANRSRAREEILKELSKIEGVYVPSLGEAKKIKRRSIRNLDTAPTPTKPIVPFIETIHDHAMLELMRGCPRTCKFCHACATYRPVRTRKPETLIRLAEELIKNTGYDELSLISLSTADYPKFGELAKVLAGKFESKKISITLPSVRMDSFSIDIARELGRVKPASVTLAPEAGTERLREFIGKNLTEEEILGGARSAFEAGIEKIKLYFMIGLPTEEQEDLQGIVDLAQKIANLGRSVFQETGRNKKRIRITISVATFIPKPHTQFEREAQISIQETLNKQSFLKSNLRDKAIELRWHDASASFLEGVFSRGDGSLSKVIEAAWKLGSRLDAWSEHFKLETWDRSFTESGIDPNNYLRKREASEKLPWDFIEV